MMLATPVTDATPLERLLNEAWEILLGILCAYAQNKVVAATRANGALPESVTRGLPAPLVSCLRPVQHLQTFVSPQRRLSDEQQAMLDRFCRQIAISQDTDLRQHLLTCCFRFHDQQCPVGARWFSRLHARAQSELQMLNSSGAADAGIDATRSLRTLAVLWSRHPVLDFPSDKTLVTALQLLQNRDQVVRNTLHHCLLLMWKGVRVSGWQPEHLRDQGLLAHCNTLLMVAQLAELADMIPTLQALERELISLHLAQQTPAPATLEAVLATIVSLQQYVHSKLLPTDFTMRSSARLSPCTSRPDAGTHPAVSDALLAQLNQAQSELAARGRSGVEGAGQATPRLTTQWLDSAYALSTALMLLPACSWQRVYQVMYHLLAQHWYQHLPLADTTITLLDQIMKVPVSDGVNPAGQAAGRQDELARRLIHRLLLAWPAASANPDLSITLASCAGTVMGNVPVNAMPEVLASSLQALARIPPVAFDSLAMFRQQQVVLQPALMLLEQGAAAVRVKAAEQLSQALLDVYLALEWLPANRFPGELLRHAHGHLLALLDTAAAWGEPAVDEQVLHDLQACQLSTQVEAAAEVAEPGIVNWQQTRQELLAYVQALTGVLDIQVRLHIQGQGDQFPEEALPALQQALLPLMRFQLLDFSLGMAARRARHQPLSGNIWLALTTEGSVMRVVLSDDSGRPEPDVLQWQQLMHRVKRAGFRETTCSVSALGRRFEFICGEA